MFIYSIKKPPTLIISAGARNFDKDRSFTLSGLNASGFRSACSRDRAYGLTALWQATIPPTAFLLVMSVNPISLSSPVNSAEE